MMDDPRATDNGQRTGFAAVICGMFRLGSVPVAWFYFVLLLSGCGYGFVVGGQFPDDAERIFLTVFENRTSEVGVENLVTQQLANQFTTRGRQNALAGKAAQADAVMKGRIQSVRIFTVARRTETVSSERRVVIRVSAHLESPDGRLLWRAEDVSGTATFQVADGGGTIDPGARRALNEAAQRVAEELFNRLTVDF